MKKHQLIEKRPNYYYGQLLLEEDFFAEQNFHVNAQRRHNLELHGSGVVSGLKVNPLNKTTVSVQPGTAIDESGQEIILKSTEDFDLSVEFRANDTVNIVLTYQDGVQQGDSSNTNSINLYAVISAIKAMEEGAGVLLAIIKLDEHGEIGPESIDYSKTKYTNKGLVSGWIRLPFHPIAAITAATTLEGETEKLLPAFRIGPTEAVSPKVSTDGKPENKEDLGAGGIMPIALPPSVKKITGFRIAGTRNEGDITFRLFLGGWNFKKEDHVNEVLLEKTFSDAPFLKDYDLGDRYIDSEYSTLSLWLRCTKRAAISLIAVEVGY